MTNGKYSVVVMSCDRYCRMWMPFVHLFDKYWLDQESIQKRIIVAENTGITSINKFEVFSPGTSTWTERLSIALKEVGTEYVLLLLEDYLFSKPINSDFVNYLKTFIIQNNVNKLTAHKNRPNHYILRPVSNHFVKFDDNSDYLTSVQLSFWKTNWLQDLINDPMDPWQFETIGTEIIKGKDNKVFYLPTNEDLHENALRRGVLHNSALQLFERENLNF